MDEPVTLNQLGKDMVIHDNGYQIKVVNAAGSIEGFFATKSDAENFIAEISAGDDEWVIGLYVQAARHWKNAAKYIQVNGT